MRASLLLAPTLLFLVVLCSGPFLFVHGNRSSNRGTTSATRNAYQILQISDRFLATQEDIKRQYHKLCLKYHPDKNIQKSNTERKVREQRFKEIQVAYETLKDPIQRREYDEKLNRTINDSDETRGTNYQQQEAHDFFSSMYNPNFFTNPYYRGSTTGRTTSFYVNGVNIHHLWNNLPQRQRSSSSLCCMQYEQEITIPLQDLYAGKVRHVFCLEPTSWWKRYQAAYRGGILSKVLVHGLAYFALAVHKVRLPLALAFLIRYIHTNIPAAPASISHKDNNSRIQFVSSIKRGWKEGTKITFPISPGSTVTFIVKEKVHDIYKRVGNDLLTSVTITKSKALRGCEIMIPPLDSSKELPIMVRIKPGQIKFGRSGDGDNRIVVKGKGWPKKDGTKGNLIVQVNVASR